MTPRRLPEFARERVWRVFFFARSELDGKVEDPVVLHIADPRGEGGEVLASIADPRGEGKRFGRRSRAAGEFIAFRLLMTIMAGTYDSNDFRRLQDSGHRCSCATGSGVVFLCAALSLSNFIYEETNWKCTGWYSKLQSFRLSLERFLKSLVDKKEDSESSLERRIETLSDIAKHSKVLVLVLQVNETLIRRSTTFTPVQADAIMSSGLILPVKDIVPGQQHRPVLKEIIDSIMEFGEPILDKAVVALLPTGKSSSCFTVPFKTATSIGLTPAHAHVYTLFILFFLRLKGCVGGPRVLMFSGSVADISEDPAAVLNFLQPPPPTPVPPSGESGVSFSDSEEKDMAPDIDSLCSGIEKLNLDEDAFHLFTAKDHHSTPEVQTENPEAIEKLTKQTSYHHSDTSAKDDASSLGPLTQAQDSEDPEGSSSGLLIQAQESEDPEQSQCQRFDKKAIPKFILVPGCGSTCQEAQVEPPADVTPAVDAGASSNGPNFVQDTRLTPILLMGVRLAATLSSRPMPLPPIALRMTTMLRMKGTLLTHTLRR
ncbi:hypothetical protein THAOC_32502, partial [Thalassiosira oceanica]